MAILNELSLQEELHRQFANNLIERCVSRQIPHCYFMDYRDGLYFSEEPVYFVGYALAFTLGCKRQYRERYPPIFIHELVASTIEIGNPDSRQSKDDQPDNDRGCPIAFSGKYKIRLRFTRIADFGRYRAE